MDDNIWVDDNATSYKPEQPITSGPSRRTRLRYWLIKQLARDTPVMINLKLTKDFYLLSRDGALFHNVEIVFPVTAIVDHDASRGEIIVHPEGTFVTFYDEEAK